MSNELERCLACLGCRNCNPELNPCEHCLSCAGCMGSLWVPNEVNAAHMRRYPEVWVHRTISTIPAIACSEPPPEESGFRMRPASVGYVVNAGEDDALIDSILAAHGR